MTKQSYKRNQARTKWLLIFMSKVQKTSHDLKVIQAWNAIQKHCVKGNTVFGPTIRRHFKNTLENNFKDITLEYRFGITVKSSVLRDIVNLIIH